MTIKELRKSVENVNKGLSYKMFKQAYLIGLAFGGKFPKTPEEANPELSSPRKRYKMPNWMKARYYRQKGVKIEDGNKQ